MQLVTANIRSDSFWHIGLTSFSFGRRKLPRDLERRSVRKEHPLARYCEWFNSVEVDSTFYAIPSKDVVRRWADATPPDFRFSVKAPCEVSHGLTVEEKKMNRKGSPRGHLLHENTLDVMHRFLEAIEPLRSRLGSVLLQFPPNFKVYRSSELAAFLDKVGREFPLAVELRHDSWWRIETRDMLRERNVCWVASDESPLRQAMIIPDDGQTKTRFARQIIPTADFLHVRWLGRRHQFQDMSGEQFDPSARLRWWAKRLQDVLERAPKVRSVFGFFRSDFTGDAARAALRCLYEFDLPLPDPAELRKNRTLFD